VIYFIELSRFGPSERYIGIKKKYLESTFLFTMMYFDYIKTKDHHDK